MIRICIILAALLFWAAFICFASSHKKAGFVLWAAALAVNIGLIAYNWAVNGYVPFVSMPQVLMFLSFCFALVYAYFRFFLDGGWLQAYMVIPSAVIMTGLCFINIKTEWHFPPALQSPFFVPHVLAYMIAYSMGAVAFALAVTRFFIKDKKRYDEGIYECVCVLFPFMTFGLFLGAIWANEVYGEFWSWDPKENWALVTWLVYILYLHFRTNKYLNKCAAYLPLAGFAGIIVTFFFVGLLSGGGGYHSY